MASLKGSYFAILPVGCSLDATAFQETRLLARECASSFFILNFTD